jgi:beta-lactamase superfamily II metal-dependent hydrolase
MPSLLRSTLLLAVLWLPFFPAAAAKSSGPLQIYFIDVEGGQSTLVVTPSKLSLLVDTGFAGARDAERIAAAMKDAGLTQLDYVVITHYHGDHAGGVPDLTSRVKVDTFVDHGPNVEESSATKDVYAAYAKATAHAKRVSVKPGEGLPFKDIRLEFLTAAGERIAEPLPGAGEANPYCAGEPEAPDDASENSQSLGLLITFGKFRFLDLGDLTKKKTLDLVCPNNWIGTVDLYLTNHHGLDPDNPKALVWAVHPLVAVMNNGPHKGGNPAAWQIVHDSPGLQDLWQLHYAMDAPPDHNSPQKFIANVDDKSDGSFIKVTAEPNGSFEIENSRNHFSRRYHRSD